jgi:hypothetical protein
MGLNGEPVLCERSGAVYDLGIDETELSDELLEYETGHPALLDGAFQTTFMSSNPVPGAPATALPIPFYIDRMQWYPHQFFDDLFSQVSPMEGTEGRKHQFQIFSDDKRIIGVQGFEARIVRDPATASQAKSEESQKVESLHPVLQMGSMMADANSVNIFAREQAKRPKMKKKEKDLLAAPEAPKPAIAWARSLLAKMSMEDVLLEDMPIMEAGFQLPASTSRAPPGVAETDASDEVIAVPESVAEDSKPKQGKRRAGTRHSKSAKAA